MTIAKPRRCPGCKGVEPAVEFYATSTRGYCKPCHRAYMRARHVLTRAPAQGAELDAITREWGRH